MCFDVVAAAGHVVQMEEILARHRKEQKELQGRVTSKKKNASKKTRKGVNDECDRLEDDLKRAHQAEIDAFNGDNAEHDGQNGDLPDSTAALIEYTENLQFDDRLRSTDSPDTETLSAYHKDPRQPQPQMSASGQSTKKPNRQKARMARKAAEQEAVIAAAEAEAASMPDQRDTELSAMKQQLQARNMVEVPIRPDGHCLYSACALGLPSDGNLDYRALRRASAEYISTHGDEFAVFLDEPLETYTAKIRDTAEWGGHLELLAIARAYRVKINVLRSSGRVDVVEFDTRVEKDGSGDGKPRADREMWLAYYEHSFGLGEHYNALKKVEESTSL